MPTEKRGAPPRLEINDVVVFSRSLRARITKVDSQFARLVDVEFLSNDLVRDLFRLGRPIQYSYLREELKTWDQQTLFAGPAISVEPPSASFPITWSQVLNLRKKGVDVVPILHAAGLSSTGEPDLDSRFPLDEYYAVPRQTLERANVARARGRRVVALGTTVTRALESAFSSQRLSGYTDLRLDGGRTLGLVTSLITGMHEEGTSHAELMEAFCGCEQIKAANREAEERNYLAHEYGDLAILDCRKVD